MAHNFQDYRGDKASGCVFSKIQSKAVIHDYAEKLLMVSFGWFRKICLIHHVSPPIKVLAWKQVEFMGLCIEKYRKYLQNLKKNRRKYV